MIGSWWFSKVETVLIQNQGILGRRELDTTEENRILVAVFGRVFSQSEFPFMMKYHGNCSYVLAKSELEAISQMLHQ